MNIVELSRKAPLLLEVIDFVMHVRWCARTVRSDEGFVFLPHSQARLDGREVYADNFGFGVCLACLQVSRYDHIEERLLAKVYCPQPYAATDV